MATETPDGSKPIDSNAAPDAGSATDEDILRMRSRLEREFAVVTQKLVDAEETIADIDISLRSWETGSRPRLTAPAPSEKGTEKITARLRAVGDGFSRIKDWVTKPHGKEEKEGGPESAGGSTSSTPGDLEDRLEGALRSIGVEIRERERESTELDRRLHDLQKDLIQARTQEQHAREMQIRIGQTKQLSEDLERKMALLDEMVRTFESSTKPDTGVRPKPKEPAAGGTKLEDRLQAAIDQALKGVAAQEKKVADVEKELAKANAGLVEERARQQRIRSMQVRLRQTRHFSADLQRSLAGLADSVEELRRRSGGLLRPEPKAAREGSRPAAKPGAPTPEAPSPKASGS